MHSNHTGASSGGWDQRLQPTLPLLAQRLHLEESIHTPQRDAKGLRDLVLTQPLLQSTRLIMAFMQVHSARTSAEECQSRNPSAPVLRHQATNM